MRRRSAANARKATGSHACSGVGSSGYESSVSRSRTGRRTRRRGSGARYSVASTNVVAVAMARRP